MWEVRAVKESQLARFNSPAKVHAQPCVVTAVDAPGSIGPLAVQTGLSHTVDGVASQKAIVDGTGIAAGMWKHGGRVGQIVGIERKVAIVRALAGVEDASVPPDPVANEGRRG